MKRLRYLSNSHNLDSLFSPYPSPPIFLPKTLISPPPNHFHTKPSCHSLIPSISSTGYASDSPSHLPFLLKFQPLHRYPSFSTASCDVLKPSTPLEASDSSENARLRNVGIARNAVSDQVLEVLDVIRKGESDLDSKLKAMNVSSLSIASITQTLRVLNSEKVSALCFFDWIRCSQPYSCYGHDDICSLVVDNCGRLDDYSAMLRVLNDVRNEGIRLTPMAFGFISISSSKEDSVTKVVEVLNEVGGSCRATGLLSLIEMFSVMGSFGMAEFVMQLTERKRSYYHIMIRESCRNSNFVKAIDMLDEMRQAGFGPDVKAYNYVLSSLCKHNKSAEATKLFEQMPDRSCSPDEVTFEIFICYSCKVGNFDFASELLDRMELVGIEPRLLTHAAFVKGYFDLQRYKEAYKYVVDSAVKYSCSSNVVYSLLARLYMNEGKVVIALNILIEMINKGIRPNVSVYVKVLKQLSQTGRKGLAKDLKSRFSSLCGT